MSTIDGQLEGKPRDSGDGRWRREGHHPVLRLGVVGEVELLDPAVEAGAGDAQELGGARLVLAGFAQGRLDQPALDLGEELVQRLDGSSRGGRQIRGAEVAADR